MKKALGLLLCVWMLSGCALLTEVGGTARAFAEPKAEQVKQYADKLDSWAAPAADISDRIAKGEEVTQDEKQALADFNAAIALLPATFKQLAEDVLTAIRLLPEKKR